MMTNLVLKRVVFDMTARKPSKRPYHRSSRYDDFVTYNGIPCEVQEKFNWPPAIEILYKLYEDPTTILY